jgi:hypothetical protein
MMESLKLKKPDFKYYKEIGETIAIDCENFQYDVWIGSMCWHEDSKKIQTRRRVPLCCEELCPLLHPEYLNRY